MNMNKRSENAKISRNAKVSRQCKMRKYFCQVRNSKIFLWNAKILRNVWFLLVLLKSIIIFCVNPSIGLADKSLFENESCILKILSFLMDFCNFIVQFSHYFFAKFFAFFWETDCRSEVFVFFASERNANMKQNFRETIFPFRWKP